VFRDTQLSSDTRRAPECNAQRDSELGLERTCERKTNVVESQQPEFRAAIWSCFRSAEPRRSDRQVVWKVGSVPRRPEYGLRPFWKRPCCAIRSVRLDRPCDCHKLRGFVQL